MTRYKTVSTEDIEMELMEFAFGENHEPSVAVFKQLGITFSDRDIIFKDGDAGEELYFILSGEVEILSSVDMDDETVLAVLGPGEIFGEMSHFDNTARSATARSVGKTCLLAFSRDNFTLIFQLHPKWTTKLVEGLCTRIRRTIQSAKES